MELAVGLIYLAGSIICHQLPERSFFWDGSQLPVCARCSGLYLGGFLAVLGWIRLKLRLAYQGGEWTISQHDITRLLLLASLPTLISVAGESAGFWNGTNVVRAFLALPLGIVAGVIVSAVVTKDLR